MTASTPRAIFAATAGVSMIAAVLVVAFSRDAFAQADLALMSAMTPGSTGDTTADVVIGQADFTHNGANNLDSTGLWLPNAVAVDAAGHLFVADTNNSRVLGFANASSFLNGAAAQVVLGQIDFQSGQCNAGSANGDVAGVGGDSLCNPDGVAVDSKGNVYVADTGNSRVLEYNQPFLACGGTLPCVAPAANVVFGQGGSFTKAICNGATAADTLCIPQGVALDSLDNLFVADTNNNRVLEFNKPLANPMSPHLTADAVFGQGGNFTTASCNQGNPAPGSGTLCGPQAVAIDKSGDLYVADFTNNRVLEFNTPLVTPHTTADEVFGQAGDFTKANCNGASHVASADTLCQPAGVAADSSGNLYLADESNNRILEYNLPLTPNTTANVVFGQNNFVANACADGNSNHAQPSATGLCAPTGVALDSSNNLFVADLVNNRVLEYNAPLANPVAPNTTANRVIGQADLTHNGVNNLDEQGLQQPRGVAIDPANGTLFVADSANNRTLGFRNAATVHGATSSAGFSLSNDESAEELEGQLDFRSSNGCFSQDTEKSQECEDYDGEIDPGNLYVTDRANNRVIEYTDPFGACVTFPCVGAPATAVFGQSGSFTTNRCNQGNPAPTGDTLCLPDSAAFDSHGNLYVADTGNNRVLEYNTPLANPMTPHTTADVVFGQGGSFMIKVCSDGKSGHPPPSADSLCMPSGVALDGSDNLYIADAGNNRVLEYNKPLQNPLSPHTTADVVFGQGSNFAAGACNGGGLTPTKDTLCAPARILLDSANDLYISDEQNNRLLEFNKPLAVPGSPHTSADLVFGQSGNFTTKLCLDGANGDPIPSADSLCRPSGITMDGGSNLYVTDTNNHRVVEYLEPLTVPTHTPTATATPTTSATATPTASPTATATSTVKATPTATATATSTTTPTATASPTPTATATPSAGRISVSTRPITLKGKPGHPKSKKLKVKNIGTGPLDVTGTAGLTAPLSASGAGILAPKKKLTITVTDTPTTGATIVTQTLRILSNDPTKPEVDISVRGNSP